MKTQTIYKVKVTTKEINADGEEFNFSMDYLFRNLEDAKNHLEHERKDIESDIYHTAYNDDRIYIYSNHKTIVLTPALLF